MLRSMRAFVPTLTLGIALAIVATSAHAAATDADVSVAAPEFPTTVRMGANGIWTWIVTNDGPAPANGVEFATDRNAKVAIDSGRSDFGPCAGGDGNIVCELGTLAVGQSVTVSAQYRAPLVGKTTILAHAHALTSLDPNPTNNDIARGLEIIPPVGGIARISAPGTVRIIRAGGVRLELTPAVSGSFAIDGTVTTPSGPIRLTHVDLRNVDAHSSHSVWLGTTPAALAQIGRALRTTPRLRARITVTDAGASMSRALTLTR
jgi:hypothetical protein